MSDEQHLQNQGVQLQQEQGVAKAETDRLVKERHFKSSNNPENKTPFFNTKELNHFEFSDGVVLAKSPRDL